MKFFLWALPYGQTDRLYEYPLTSMALTDEQVSRVKIAATKDGWHSFRREPETMDVPDFSAGVIR